MFKKNVTKREIVLLLLSLGIFISCTAFGSGSIPLTDKLKSFLDTLQGWSYYIVGIGIIMAGISYFSGRFSWVTGLAIALVGVIAGNVTTVLDFLGMSAGAIC